MVLFGECSIRTKISPDNSNQVESLNTADIFPIETTIFKPKKSNSFEASSRFDIMSVNMDIETSAFLILPSSSKLKSCRPFI